MKQREILTEILLLVREFLEEHPEYSHLKFSFLEDHFVHWPVLVLNDGTEVSTFYSDPRAGKYQLGMRLQSFKSRLKEAFGNEGGCVVIDRENVKVTKIGELL